MFAPIARRLVRHKLRWPKPAIFQISNSGRKIHYWQLVEASSGAPTSSSFIPCTVDEVLAEVRRRRARISFSPFVGLVALATAALGGFLAPVDVALLVLLLCLVASGLAWKIDQGRRTVILSYTLDGDIALRFSRVRRACAALVGAANVWLVDPGIALDGSEPRPPQRSTVARDSVVIAWKPISPIRTNVDTPRIGRLGFWVLFLPDLVWIQRVDGSLSTASYESIVLDCGKVRLSEWASAPPDARIVGLGSTKFAVVEYAEIVMEIGTEPALRLFVSSLEAAQGFVQAFNRKKKVKTQPSVSEAVVSGGIRYDDDPQETWRIRDGDPPHKVLGVSVDAPPARIKAAYHRLAKHHHPDRLLDKSPVGLERAQHEMALINKAFEAMMNRNGRR